MTRLTFFKSILMGTFVSAAMIACQSLLPSADRQISPDGVATLSDMDEIFIKQIVGDTVINSGLQLEQKAQGEIVDFSIYNYSDEPITFQDQSFGVRGFCPDTQKKQWELYTIPFLQTNYASASVTLPPNLKVFDREVNNTLAFFRETLEVSGCNEIRLLIIGRGTVTNTVYGAYIDIDLAQ